MISIIICSRNADIDKILRDNISNFIGIKYELVIIDNSSNKYSIFSAYNEGVRRAKYEILCFMHEDVLFHTENWGQHIINHFKDKTVGLIGVAGTHFLPSVPTYWFTSPFVSENNLTNDCGTILENYRLEFFHGKTLVDSVAVDGLSFYMKKELFNRVSFDETIFSGFHYYDMDICMQVISINYRVCVCNDVLIEHAWSEKSLHTDIENFNKNQEKFFIKWKELLPISRGIDEIPQYVLDRVNRLYESAYDAKIARNSKAYKIGKLILSPFKMISKRIK